MSAAENERIAPVTYLFGAQRASTDEAGTISAASSTQPASTSGPRFVDLAAPAVVDEMPPASRPAGAPRAAGASAKAPGSFDRISNVSMYALARRGMSSREMRDYLLGREFEVSAVDEEVDRLEKTALLDDYSLAETLIHTLQSRKGLGRSALIAELRRRGIDHVAIESALAVLGDDDELERAVAIAVKRAGQLHALDATTARRRLGDFLMRRGYSGSVVSRAVQQALAPSGSSRF